MATVHETIDRARLSELIDHERGKLLARTEGSQRYYERALAVMPRGVPSSFQAADPRPIYLSHGEGSHVWDVDGNEYVDFHNGFGVMCVGHANPAIVAAVRERAGRGSHFAAPTEGSIVVAEELVRRFGLPQWRFTNSGTESTMDAIHLARAATGRDLVLKIEGSYHGHHDAVMVSVRPPLDQLGERGVAGSVPFGAGHPRAVSELTKAIPFNDADLLERVLDEIGDQVAALILEPAMMNITIVAPKPGYLERVRELTAKHGVVLVFDEVKTGATIAAGGAVERFGVTARRRLPGQGDRRRLPQRRGGDDRDARRPHHHRQRAPGRDLQRQPALHGGRPGGADRGPHRRGVRRLRGARRAPARRPRRRHRALRPAVPHRRARQPRAASSSPPSRSTSTATTRPRSTRSSRRCRGCTT